MGGEAWAEGWVEGFSYERGNLVVFRTTAVSNGNITNATQIFIKNNANVLKDFRIKTEYEVGGQIRDRVTKYIEEEDEVKNEKDPTKKNELRKKYRTDPKLKQKAIDNYLDGITDASESTCKRYLLQRAYPELNLSKSTVSANWMNSNLMANMSEPKQIKKYDVVCARFFTQRIHDIGTDTDFDKDYSGLEAIKKVSDEFLYNTGKISVKEDKDIRGSKKIPGKSHKENNGSGSSSTNSSTSTNPENGEAGDVINNLTDNSVSKTDPGAEEDVELTEAEKQQEQCRKNAGFLGFLICPFILQTSNNVMEWAYRTIYEDLSRIETSVLEMKDSNPVFSAWAKIRDLANIVFIIVFLIVVLSQITGIGIDNYGIKKILPKLIASAILINLSFIISQLFVDTSNLLGVSLSKIFSITEFSHGSRTYPVMGISGWANALSIGAIVAGIFALLLNPGIIISLALLLIPMIGALLLAVALLMVRQAVAIMLVVTSPIAIALMLLPNTKSFVDRYKKLASAMWLFYPICAIIVGGSNFAARVFLMMVQSGGTEHDFLYSIMAIAVMTLPFFATPGILRKTMDGVGGIGSKLNNFRNASVSRASNAAKNSRLVKRAQSSLNTHSISKRHRASAYRDRMKLNQERREDDLYSNRGYMNEQEELANMEQAEKLNTFAREEKMEAARFKHEEATNASAVVERMQANKIRHEEAMDSTMRRDRMKTAEMNHQVSMADAGSRVGMAGYYNTMTDAKINSAQSRTEKQMRDATMDAIGAGNLEISGGSWIDSAGAKQTAPTRITNPNDANQMRQALQAAASSNNHIAAGAIMEYMNKNGMTDDVHRAYKAMSNGGAMGMNIEDSAYRNVRSAMANGVLAAGIKEDDPGIAKWAKNTLAGKATTVDDSTIEAFADMSADAISKMDDKAMARTQAVLQSRRAAFVGSGPIGGKLGQAINNMDDFKKAMTGTSDNDLRLQNKTKASLKNQTMTW